MKRRLPILSIIAVFHSAYYIFLLNKSDKAGAYAAMEAMATGYVVIGGIAAIILDLILLRMAKNNSTFYFLELLIFLTGIMILYN
jgi:hypothetical protein